MSYIFKIAEDLRTKATASIADYQKMALTREEFARELSACVKALGEETIKLQSDSETVLFRISVDGTGAELGDIRTGGWYQLQTRATMFQQLVEMAARCNDLKVLKSRILDMIESNVRLLQKSVAQLHVDLAQISTQLKWRNITSEVGNIRTGDVYKGYTEVNALQDAWCILRTIEQPDAPAEVVSISDLKMPVPALTTAASDRKMRTGG